MRLLVKHVKEPIVGNARNWVRINWVSTQEVLIDAGKYFLRRQKRSLAISEREIIHIACKSLGLNELSEFKPEERVIEYMIDNNDKNLLDKSIKKFAELTSSESLPREEVQFRLIVVHWVYH